MGDLVIAASLIPELRQSGYGLVVFREPDGSRARDSFAAVAGRFRGNTLAET
jgi:hypothetical protein